MHAFVRGRHRTAVGWIEEYGGDADRSPDSEARFRWRYAACQLLPDIGRFPEAKAIADAMALDAASNGDAVFEAHALVIRAFLAEMEGDVASAVDMSSEALARARAHDDRGLLEAALSHRSGTLHVYGRYTALSDATRHEALAEAERLARELREMVPPHSRRLALAPLLLAAALWAQGQYKEAYRLFKEVERAALTLGTSNELMYAFVSEAAIATTWTDFEAAARAFGAFEAVRQRMGYSLERAQSARPEWIHAVEETLRASLGAARFDVFRDEGRRADPARIAASEASASVGDR